MPSRAYSTFFKNYEQVNKLKLAYEDELHKNPRRGKRSLDHYTRAAIMFLCSSFEVYFEDVLQESCVILTRNCSHANDLPKQVKKTISKHVRESNNELEPCIFANNFRKLIIKYYINFFHSVAYSVTIFNQSYFFYVSGSIQFVGNTSSLSHNIINASKRKC